MTTAECIQPEPPKSVRFADVEPHPFAEAAVMEAEPSPAELIGGRPTAAEARTWEGLFFVAADHRQLMARVRVPGGQLSAEQLRGVAAIARDYSTGYVQVTTRSNFQIRHIAPADAPTVTRLLQAVGLHPAGAGANNPRNITTSPLAGVDADELFDVSPLVREWAGRVTSDAALRELPRKFNVAFDGGGVVNLIEDANDVGAHAVSTAEGVRFRIRLGGAVAGDLGILVATHELIDALTAIARVYIANRDRCQRAKTRLKGVMEHWTAAKFLAETDALLGRPLPRAAVEPNASDTESRPLVGVLPQSQAGLSSLGVAMPMGSVTPEQLTALAEVAERFGGSEVRLTPAQSFLIPNIPDGHLGLARDDLRAAGYETAQSNVRAGMVACTGSAHCPFAAADTKAHARELADHLDARLELEQPINIHLTGCPNSCAQHYVGDIGLLATTVDNTPAYHVFVGGGFGRRRALGRQLFRALPLAELKLRLEAMLKLFNALKKRGESFQEFTHRQDPARLAVMFNLPRTLKP